MARIPNTQKEFSKWIQFIGVKFDNDFTVDSMICRSHFNDEFGDSRLVDIVHKNGVIETKLGGTQKCRYCGCTRVTGSMTAVPKDKSRIDQWTKILGQQFENNGTHICRSHFEAEWRRSRPTRLLPIANHDLRSEKSQTAPNQIKSKTMPPGPKRICAYCRESKSSCDLKLVRKNPYHKTDEELWIQILGESLYRQALENCSTVVCRSHFDEARRLLRSNSVEWMPNKVKEEVSYMNIDLYTCCYCGEEKTAEKMAKIPATHEEFSKWSNFLGGKFRNSFTIRSMICRSHFDDEFGDSRLVDTVIMDKVIDTKLGGTQKCCYCGDTRVVRSMTPVPYCRLQIEEWIYILGQRFYENFRKSKSGFICRSHFKANWTGSRPNHVVPVENHFESSVKKNPGKNENNTKIIVVGVKNNCGFCEKLKSYQDLTMITQEQYNREVWGQIFGEDFYEKSLANRLICRNHFNEERKSGLPDQMLPNEVKGEVQEDCFMKMDLSEVLMKNTSPSIEIKLEGPDIDEDFNKEIPHILSDNIKSECQKMNNEVKLLNDSKRHIFCETRTQQELFINQDGPSDSKRIKLEVKEEEE